MALTATTVLLVAFATFHNSLAAPLATDDIIPAELSTAPASLVTSSALSTPSLTSLDSIAASVTTSIAPVASSEPATPSGSTSSTTIQTLLSSVDPPSSLSLQLSTSATALLPSSSSSLQLPTITLSPATSTVEFTTTVVSTIYQLASPITITAPPTTVTDTITIIPPPTPSSTVRETSWSAPPQMTDLSAFNVKNFAYGKKNMRIIVNDATKEDTHGDSDTSSKSSSSSSSHSLLGPLTGALGGLLHAVAKGIIPPPPKKASSSFLELFYPAHSINPEQKPQGGADFYAAPLDLRGARNVSLAYSVFFPSNFDWVQGGKMPGIYGGHDGCSGGDEALDCFSTRLMWRKGGAGELYLYAPKDKQTAALCKTPPQTVCESEYGLSVARGSFKFAAGNWTHVRQTVALNTPGKQDGAFTLDVNGKRVIDVHDVFYRGAPSAGSHKTGLFAADADEEQGEHVLYDEDAPQVKMDLADGSYDADARRVVQDSIEWLAPPVSYIPFLEYTPTCALLGPPAMDMQHLVVARQDWNETSIATVTVTRTTAVTLTTIVPLPPQTTTVQPSATKTAYVVDMETGLPLPVVAIAYAAPQAVGFTGLFFSTFFGGHETRFATPKDQFSWFKDFAMTIND